MTKRNTRNIAVGDVIQSPLFEFASVSKVGRPDEIISVGQNGRIAVTHFETREVVVEGQKTTAQIKSDPYKNDRSDVTRRDAKFVVVSTKMQGGGCDGRGGGYPDGNYIKARRLTAEGSYDPEGELIGFYMCGCFMNMIEEVELVGRVLTKQVPVQFVDVIDHELGK